MKKILYFTATWCGPCKALTPKMEKLGGQINYTKIDVDQNSEMTAKYNVRNVPLLVLVDHNGNELNRMVGNQPESQILNFYNG